MLGRCVQILQEKGQKPRELPRATNNLSSHQRITAWYRLVLRTSYMLRCLMLQSALRFMPGLDPLAVQKALIYEEEEQLIAGVDHAFLDATFWDDNELPGRDMSAIPHPRVARVMDRLQSLPASQRAKVRFIHYNHTNPIRDPGSAQSREVAARGYAVARRGESVCLSN